MKIFDFVFKHHTLVLSISATLRTYETDKKYLLIPSYSPHRSLTHCFLRSTMSTPREHLNMYCSQIHRTKSNQVIHFIYFFNVLVAFLFLLSGFRLSHYFASSMKQLQRNEECIDINTYCVYCMRVK